MGRTALRTTYHFVRRHRDRRSSPKVAKPWRDTRLEAGPVGWIPKSGQVSTLMLAAGVVTRRNFIIHRRSILMA
jgi:hypothetical protein